MELDSLYALIRKFEGLRLRPYLCPARVWTIGYGHTGPDVFDGCNPISVEHAEMLMSKDVASFVKSALRLSPVLANHPNKMCAIADFCYNLGSGRYKISTLRKRVNAEDWEGAVVELMKWNKGGGKVLAGLTTRRKAEAVLLLG